MGVSDPEATWMSGRSFQSRPTGIAPHLGVPDRQWGSRVVGSFAFAEPGSLRLVALSGSETHQEGMRHVHCI